MKVYKDVIKVLVVAVVHVPFIEVGLAERFLRIKEGLNIEIHKIVLHPKVRGQETYIEFVVVSGQESRVVTYGMNTGIIGRMVPKPVLGRKSGPGEKNP